MLILPLKQILALHSTLKNDKYNITNISVTLDYSLNQDIGNLSNPLGAYKVVYTPQENRYKSTFKYERVISIYLLDQIALQVIGKEILVQITDSFIFENNLYKFIKGTSWVDSNTKTTAYQDWVLEWMGKRDLLLNLKSYELKGFNKLPIMTGYQKKLSGLKDSLYQDLVILISKYPEVVRDTWK